MIKDSRHSSRIEDKRDVESKSDLNGQQINISNEINKGGDKDVIDKIDDISYTNINTSKDNSRQLVNVNTNTNTNGTGQ